MIRVINDSNWREILAEDRRAGRLTGALPRETPFGGLPCAAVYADSVPLIPEVEWKERIAELTAKKLWPQDAYDRFSPKLQYQNGLPYCWAFSFTQTVEILRAMGNLPYIQLAPESLGGAVGYRDSGNSLDSTLTYAANHGICRRSMVPEFSRSPSRWKDGWQDDALNFVPSEWWDIGRSNVWAETVSALLSPMPIYVGLSWWRHAVAYTKLIVDSRGEICAYTPNTHGPGKDRILAGSRKIPDIGCFAPRVVTFYVENIAGLCLPTQVGGPIRDGATVLADAKEILERFKRVGLQIDVRLKQ